MRTSLLHPCALSNENHRLQMGSKSNRVAPSVFGAKPAPRPSRQLTTLARGGQSGDTLARQPPLNPCHPCLSLGGLGDSRTTYLSCSPSLYTYPSSLFQTATVAPGTAPIPRFELHFNRESACFISKKRVGHVAIPEFAGMMHACMVRGMQLFFVPCAWELSVEAFSTVGLEGGGGGGQWQVSSPHLPLAMVLLSSGGGGGWGKRAPA
ncbi:hypothetical protein HDK77DRAFT_184076 [Phyllosticta capitalensis]